MSRYDFFPIPVGWFFVGMPDDVAPGEIKTIRAFGQDLVLWRDEGGVAHLHEAYCPHLGAHIGVGGKVQGNTIQCPFHLWTFKGDGTVDSIPYASRINDKACLRSYPVREHYGCLYAWHHPEGAAPEYDLMSIPELDSGELAGPLVKEHIIKCCLQEMAENTVDGAHFQTIHHHPGAAEYENVSFDGPLMAMDSKQLFPSSKGPVEGTLCTRSQGFGFGVVRYKTLIEICMLTATTPIEKDLSRQVNIVYYRNPTQDEKVDRIAQSFYKEVNRQLGDDIPIWENKIYREKPFLCDGDGPIARFRKWASQFYVA